MIPRITSRFFWLSDLIVLTLAFELTYLIIPFIQPLFEPDALLSPEIYQVLSIWNGPLPLFADLLWILVIVAAASLIVLASVGNHEPLLDQSYTRIVVGGLLAPAAGVAIIALVLFALKDYGISRLFIFAFWMLAAAGIAAYRIGLRLYLARRREMGFYAKNVVFIGRPAAVDWMARYFSENILPIDYRMFGYLGLERDRDAADPKDSPIPHLGHVGELGSLLIHRPIHEVIAVQPMSDGDWIAPVIEDCDHFGVVLRIVPEALLIGERRSLRMLYPYHSLYLPAVVLTPLHWDSDALLIKRLFDIVVSAAALLALSPVFLATALAIKVTTPQLPVFYPWRVVGQNGVEFTGYKFTTMIADADVAKERLLAFNEMSGPVFKIRNDPRVTPLGKYLRKFSINELPQLWSVLTGHMSLVGPRPAFRHELERYEFWHKRKLTIKPGITCLWQVRGRNRISNFDDWVKMDLEYIDNWSLWLDIKILIRTAWVVVRGSGS